MYIVAVKIKKGRNMLYEFKTKKDAIGFQEEIEKHGYLTSIANSKINQKRLSLGEKKYDA